MRAKKNILMILTAGVLIWWFFFPKFWLSPPQVLHVKADYTKVYECMARECKVIDYAHKNAQLGVEGNDFKNGWIKILLEKGGFGYINNEDLIEKI